MGLFAEVHRRAVVVSFREVVVLVHFGGLRFGDVFEHWNSGAPWRVAKFS